MRNPEQKATVLLIVVVAVLMSGMSIHIWIQDHDWHTAAIPLVMGVIGIPLGIFKGRYLIRGWFGERK